MKVNNDLGDVITTGLSSITEQHQRPAFSGSPPVCGVVSVCFDDPDAAARVEGATRGRFSGLPIRPHSVFFPLGL